MYHWSQEQVSYMHDALRFTDYYEKIASYIVPHLCKDDTVCDAGCGLGELGIALLPYCAAVTCVDRDPIAIADLQSRRISNITALCGDVEEQLPTKPYDAMTFCLFGSTEQALGIAKAQCRGKIFMVKRDYAYHRFSSENIPLGEYNAHHTAYELEERKIPYQVQPFTADFGQPFRSMEEALHFFAVYNRSEKPVTPKELEKRLTEGPSAEFPLYLPHTKHLQLFVLDTNDIP